MESLNNCIPVSTFPYIIFSVYKGIEYSTTFRSLLRAGAVLRAGPVRFRDSMKQERETNAALQTYQICAKIQT